MSHKKELPGSLWVVRSSKSVIFLWVTDRVRVQDLQLLDGLAQVLRFCRLGKDTTS